MYSRNGLYSDLPLIFNEKRPVLSQQRPNLYLWTFTELVHKLWIYTTDFLFVFNEKRPVLSQHRPASIMKKPFIQINAYTRRVTILMIWMFFSIRKRPELSQQRPQERKIWKKFFAGIGVYTRRIYIINWLIIFNKKKLACVITTEARCIRLDL